MRNDWHADPERVVCRNTIKGLPEPRTVADFTPGQFVTIALTDAQAVVVDVGPNKVLVRIGSMTAWKDPGEIFPLDADRHPAVLADRAAHPDPFDGINR